MNTMKHEKSIFPIYDEQKELAVNPFNEDNTNTRKIKALLMVQFEIAREVLTDRQRFLVKYVVMENHTQAAAAKILGISEPSVSKMLRFSIQKLRSYIRFCDSAICIYEQLDS